ncbi:MAG TPA: murein transglycosylase, partial [Rhodospirillales bacterium]|nr:murein transglycosylase [Rhodospirillales bacterium]
DNGRPEGLFTGYFEMQLQGSWIKTGAYTTPIYERPSDNLVAKLADFDQDKTGSVVGKVRGRRFVPYDSRAQINNGALADRGQEILWVDSPVDAFFLHVQGSGRVIMADGSIVRLGFAGRNGRPYKSIGGELIRRGEMTRERTSMQSIRAWLRAHPGQASQLMETNGSYIFFRVVAGALKSLPVDQGPVGAAGLALTPGRSLAVDRRFIPLGLPVWLDTTDPLNPGQPLRRLVVTQDTGSAIKGPVRGDLFWGFGEAAATRAGLMKQSGRYFLLLPKQP